MMTQGRGDGNEWVTSFMVTYSLDAFHWQYVSDLYGNQRVSLTALLITVLSTATSDCMSVGAYACMRVCVCLYDCLSVCM